MTYQSLYRRFRPQRFSEVIGQDHLVRALRNAVLEDRVGHAYLLSGPRGTGKTSTARILAKALNCERLGSDGEPCGECDRCTSVEAGNALELIEMDAASHNSVNDIRELVASVSHVSPGSRKVYLLDEVHMLSQAAANTLLKTLEEPPAHVVFILATTDPQRVLPTIRSRTQHIELSLVGADELTTHLQNIAQQADIDLTPEMLEYLIEQGGGSVRDALSALDQIAAAGGIPNDRADALQLVQALASGDLAASLAAIAKALGAGADPRNLAERTARQLRDMFLAINDVPLEQVSDTEAATCKALAEQMGVRATVRALELLGVALSQMPQSSDRRLTLEAAVVQLLADKAQEGDSPSQPAAADTATAAETAAETAAAEAATATGTVKGTEEAAAAESDQPSPGSRAKNALQRLNQTGVRQSTRQPARQSTNQPVDRPDTQPARPEPEPTAKPVPEPETVPQAAARPAPALDLANLHKSTTAIERQAIRLAAEEFPGSHLVRDDPDLG